MSDKIDSKEKYDRLFGSFGDDQEAATVLENRRKEKALESALDIRKFEIELYWKRAAYFWTLITVAFAGYFGIGLKGNNGDVGNEFDRFIIACIGFVISFGWVLVTKGSKYWQENWERHVDALEDEFIGPLYKTMATPKEEQKNPFLTGAYPYSVSKVNQLISCFITFIWFLLIVRSMFFLLGFEATCLLKKISIVGFLLVLVAIGILRCKGEGTSHKSVERKKIDFISVTFDDREDTKNKDNFLASLKECLKKIFGGSDSNTDDKNDR